LVSSDMDLCTGRSLVGKEDEGTRYSPHLSPSLSVPIQSRQGSPNDVTAWGKSQAAVSTDLCPLPACHCRETLPGGHCCREYPGGAPKGVLRICEGVRVSLPSTALCMLLSLRRTFMDICHYISTPLFYYICFAVPILLFVHAWNYRI